MPCVIVSEPWLDAGTPADRVGIVLGIPDEEKPGAAHMPAWPKYPGGLEHIPGPGV